MNVFKAIGGFVSKNERTILTCVGIGCEVWAIVEAFRQAPKFKELADEIREKKENGDEIDGLEVVKKAAGPALKVGVPAALSMVAQVANHKKTSDTIQSLTNMCMLAREGHAAVLEQVAEEHGQEEADRIEEKAVAKKITSDTSGGNFDDYVIVTGHGNTKFYDEMSGRYFLSDINFVDSVINDLNARLIEVHEHNGCILLNDLYDALDIPRIPIGYEKVWFLRNGLISKRITSDIDESNQLYAILSITNKPKYIEEA